MREAATSRSQPTPRLMAPESSLLSPPSVIHAKDMPIRGRQ